MNLTLLNLAPAAETATAALSPATATAAGQAPEESGLDFAGQLDAQLGQLAAGVPGNALTPAGEPKGKGFTALAADGKAALAAAAAAGNTAAGKAQATDLVSQLAAAVEKLTQPGTVPAALTSRDARVETRVSGDAGNAEDKEDDQQAIQSLFAMLGLPAPLMAPAQATASGSGTQAAAEAETARTAAAVLGGASALTAAPATPATASASPAAAHAAHAGTDNTAAAAAPAVAPAESLESAAMLLSAAQPQKDLPAATADSAPQPVVQATALPPAAHANAAPAATALPVTAAAPQITSPLATPEWQQALGQQVLMFTRHGQQSAELRLHPEDLGALQISLKIDNDQAQLHFASPHQQVRAAVEAAMPHLRTALAESGINLGQSSVGSDAGGWQQAQQQSAQQQGGRSAPNSWDAADPLAAAEPLAVPASLVSRLQGSSGVDIFA
ncbi:flagellar hook-length control protein FliK [Chimaeribacter arupi]|nr:flagellar hook-length control protein FliK [Chimaeribacter arupi]